MTRHNLDEHLSWLLQTKPSIPPATTSLPPLVAPFGPLHTSETPPLLPLNAIEFFAVSGTQEAPQRERGLAGDDMARLRTAQGSASKPQMLSLGPPEPPMGSSSSTAPAIKPRMQQPIRKSSPALKTPIPAMRFNQPQFRDVEIMDLTDARNAAGGSPTFQPESASGSRKRKSEEYEQDLFPPGAVPHVVRNDTHRSQPEPRLSQSFATIDEIAVEPNEPPPPYSTIPPKIGSPNGWQQAHEDTAAAVSTSSVAHDCERVMQDSEEDDDEDIVDFTGGRQKRVMPNKASTSKLQLIGNNHLGSPLHLPSKQVTPISDACASRAPPSSLKTGDPSVMDAALLRTFLTSSDVATESVIARLKSQLDDLSQLTAEQLDRDEDPSDLMAQVADIDGRIKAIESLCLKKADYKSLISEKEQSFNAMRHAVKLLHGLTEAKAANDACKSKIQELETSCADEVRLCMDDLKALQDAVQHDIGSTRTRAVVVDATQVAILKAEAGDASILSSSKIAQTQVTRAVDPSTPKVWHDRSGTELPDLRRVDAYFSPPARINNPPSLIRTKPPTGTSNFIPDNLPYDIGDDDDILMADSGTLFSNRMGTPPARYDHADDDDYGLDDEEDMLEFAEGIENSGLPPTLPARDSHRPALAEKSGNSQSKRNTMSTKKSKSSHKHTEAELERLLFCHPWGRDVKTALVDRFHLKGFRASQMEAINATLSGKDVFVLMPTGGGKSLCYQLPAIIKSGKTLGTTIVVSPLLSLMEDQVLALRALGIQAFSMTGETPDDEKRHIKDGLDDQDHDNILVELLYVSPEMLSKNLTMIAKFEMLYRRGLLARLVIDEAHCVSQWGHDFRPDYKALGDVRRKFPDVPTMALTATATENVKIDVVNNLGIEGCEVLTRSFNRPNLFYEVRDKGRGKDDLESIAALIQEKYRRQCGIIYCLSRAACEGMAEALRDKYSIKAAYYHAGLESAKKKEVQKQWQAGKCHVIVATIAFGMGIDKPDVRFVIHHSLPKSLEGYYQETGRAGRDGGESGCYLFYGPGDASKLRRMIDDDKNGSWEQKDRQYQMLRKMVQFCENKSDCRRVQVLAYFSEAFKSEECGAKCDNCNSASTFETVDYTKMAQRAINVVRQVKDYKVTVLYCVDLLRGAKNKKMKDLEHTGLPEFGEASDMDRGDVERLFYLLLSEQALLEWNSEKNRAGFTTQYVGLGPRCNDFGTGKRSLHMQICMSPRAKPKPAERKKPRKEAQDQLPKQSKKTTNPRARAELPKSTFVSSPIQAVSKRKKQPVAQRHGQHTGEYEQDNVVASDPEDEDYNNGDDGESDAFESLRDFNPVRVRGQQEVNKTRALGPPIKVDEAMESLNDIHRMIVEQFVEEARKKCQDLMLQKGLRTVPFSDTMLRAMAIHWTDNQSRMLRYVQGVIPDKVDLYGKYIYPSIKAARQHYMEIMTQSDDRSRDPHQRNVINLVSDNEEEEYGSIDLSDAEAEEEDDDPGVPSRHFANQKVHDFNQKFAFSQGPANQSAATAAAELQRPRKGASKAKRRRVGGRGSTGYGGEGGGGGGRRSRYPSASSTGNHFAAAAVKKKASTAAGRGGYAASSAMKRDGNGISMMPT